MILGIASITNYLDERKIDPGIRVRKNARSPSRRKAVIEQKRYEE